MTREEAISLIRSECERVVGSLMVDRRACEDIVREIFDDIESRTCKNCKFFEEESDPPGEWIVCEKLYIEGGGIGDSESFGCNKFERKDDE